MHYYIDGYNLLFRKVKAGENLSTQRQALITELNYKASLLGLDVTLVFDAQYQPDDETRSHFNALEIRFSAKGETADQLILNELKRCKNPAQNTVVTSDKKLAWYARCRLAKTESIEDFMSSLNRRCRNKRTPAKKEALLPPVVLKEEPTLSSPSAGTDDYYLKIFEKMAEGLPPPKVKKPSTKPRKSPFLPQDPKKPEEDDMARWLRLFTQQ